MGQLRKESGVTVSHGESPLLFRAEGTASIADVSVFEDATPTRFQFASANESAIGVTSPTIDKPSYRGGKEGKREQQGEVSRVRGRRRLVRFGH